LNKKFVLEWLNWSSSYEFGVEFVG